ncbi:TPA: Tubulin polyglutamylase ttll13P, variant 2 [Trebouxia sp. C0005]
MQPMQKINHFAGMLELCRKKTLARSITAMAALFPGHYHFCPKTYVLPEDLQVLWRDFKSSKKGKPKTLILKPDSGSQGRGIKLVQSASGMQQALRDLEGVDIIASKYLHKPLLVNGFKFDLRVYVLVLACDPLRVFIYREGLVRFCTEKYKAPQASNLKAAYMHLTNYAVNKHNENFVSGPEAHSSKWDFAMLRTWMAEQGHDFEAVWQQIEELVVLSLLSVQPLLQMNYRTAFPATNDGFSCFELLGYDVLLDQKCRPWLLEVNHSPSFSTDTPLDLAVKKKLILETVGLVRVDAKQLRRGKAADKQLASERLLRTKGRATADQTPAISLEEMQYIRLAAAHKRDKYEARHMGNFRRIYPSTSAPLQAKYEWLLQGSARLFASSMKAKAHNTIGRIQERRKAEMQLAAEAEAASKAKASLLRENVRKANQRVLVEAQRLKAEGRATRDVASQALLATLRNQAPPGYLGAQSGDSSPSSCASPVRDTGHNCREDSVSAARRLTQSLELPQQRMTADDVLLRQRRARPHLGPAKGVAQMSHSPALHIPLSLGHKSPACRSQALDYQGLLHTDSLLGSLTSVSPVIDDHGLLASRLSQTGSTQVSADSDSGSEQRSTGAANISVTQAGASLVRLGSSAASRPGRTPSGHLTVERFPVSPRLLGRRSVSLSKQTSKKALHDSTAAAAAVAALQLTGAPLQSLGSRRTGRLSRELASSSSSSVESGSRSRSRLLQHFGAVDLQPGSSDAPDFVAVGDSHNAEDLLRCLKAEGVSDGSRVVSGGVSELPMPPRLSEMLQSSKQDVLQLRNA